LYLANVLYVVFVLCVCLGDHFVQALAFCAPFKIDNKNNNYRDIYIPSPLPVVMHFTETMNYIKKKRQLDGAVLAEH